MYIFFEFSSNCQAGAEIKRTPQSLFADGIPDIRAGYLGRRMNIQPQENNGAGNQRHELHEGNKTHNFNSSPGPIMGFALRESS